MTLQKIIQPEDICNYVHIIRGQQVMLDFDLARIYGYDVKQLNRQVKRNISRFPDDFMFQLSQEEVERISRYQIGTSIQTRGVRGGRSYKPYAFTEQGIYMLAAVLKGELAEIQSIYIMRTFKEMRHYLQENRQFVTQSELNQLEYKTNQRFDQMQTNIEQINKNFLLDIPIKEFVIYKGQKFEADKAYIDIYQQAKKTIYIVDDYVNIKTLHLLSHKQKGVEVILFTENKNGKNGKLTQSEIDDFNSQYPTLSIKPNKECHDRFIILDYQTQEEQVYLCGASSKDAGNKVCSILQFSDITLFHPVAKQLLKKGNS